MVGIFHALLQDMSTSETQNGRNRICNAISSVSPSQMASSKTFHIRIIEDPVQSLKVILKSEQAVLFTQRASQCNMLFTPHFDTL